MDYGKDRDKGSLETFLKEMGSQSEEMDKYVFKASDISSLQGQVIVISEQ